jgi:CubicO group peptidase (beta-lactamase class C family)
VSKETIDNLYFSADSSKFINAMVIIKDDKLIAEKYFNGFAQIDGHIVRSITKSFTSALVGIAIKNGYLLDINERMIKYFPEYSTLDLDPKINEITIKHLLTMHAGFDTDRNIFFDVFNSNNWIKTTLELPLLFNPGSRFRYNTFASHLLAGILTKATKMDLKRFAENYLLNQLQISLRDWKNDPQGIRFGGSDMYFSPRDLARFGQLYLKHGSVDGNEIILSSWIDQTLFDYTNFEDSSWGVLQDIGYGFLWWLGKIQGFKVFLALGHGGQYILCIPQLNMIVVTVSNSYVDWDVADEQERKVLELVSTKLLIPLGSGS